MQHIVLDEKIKKRIQCPQPCADGIRRQAPILLILDESAEVLPTDIFESMSANGFEESKKKYDGSPIAADGVGAAIAPV
jgi:hypothetical protein